MSLGLAFWILMFIWLVITGIGIYRSGVGGIPTDGLLPYVLFLLLGWAVFGAPIKG